MKPFHGIILLISLPLFPIEIGGMASGVRKKRVMFGLPTTSKDRDEYYPHFRYFMFLAKEAFPGQIDESPSWLQKFFKKGLSPTPLMQHCGGSLLTPSIVQTACHCLAKYTKKKDDNFTYAVPMNVWENRIYSYFGSNVLDKMYYMLIPRYYVIYQACCKVTATKANIYDFALIVNKDSIDQKGPNAKISYAPAYKQEDLRNFYYTALQKQFTCLFVGFGKWNLLPPVDGKAKIDPTNSDVLRWGWRTLRSYEDCYSASYSPTSRVKGYFDYHRYATWSCFMSTTKNEFLYAAMPGDSGGPVTCDNVYFGVQSFGSLPNAKDIISLVSPTAHTAFENSAEYRDDLIRFCKEFGTGDSPENPVTHHPNPFDPTPPPLARSKHYPILLDNFLILASMGFTCIFIKFLPMYRI